MAPTNVHELFIQNLQKLFDAEQQLTQALPQMADAAQDSELKQGFTEHLQQTREHVRRLESLSDALNYQPGNAEHSVMKALIDEGNKLMQEITDPVLKDLALIGAANTVEHVEMAGYQEAILMAKQMKHDQAEKALQDTFHEEEMTSKKLEKLAEKIGKLAKENMNTM